MQYRIECLLLDRKRRTNPSFLSIDEAARDRRRLEQMVKGIAEGPREKDVVISNVGYNGSNGLIGKSNPLHKSYFHPPTGFHYPKTKGTYNNRKPDKYVKIFGEAKNFVVQQNYETKMIELYCKDFFVGQLFKLRFGVGESKEISNLLAQARNELGQSQNKRIGETTHFIVDIDTNKQATLYGKNNQEIKLGFNEEEITPLLDFLAKARSQV